MSTTPSVAFNLLDDGTAKASLSFLDPKNNPIPAPTGVTVSWTSSDPNVVVAPATDGLSATLTPAGPLESGATITAVATLADGTTKLTATGTVNVVADPSKVNGLAMAIA